MLDIKFVRNNPDVVKQNIKNKFQDEKLPLVDEVIELDQKNRDIKGEVEALRAEKNKISKQIGACMAQGKKEEAEELKKKVDLGDIVQLHSRKEGWHHSIIISVKESSKICYAGHSKRHKWANINKIKKGQDKYRIIRFK